MEYEEEIEEETEEESRLDSLPNEIIEEIFTNLHPMELARAWAGLRKHRETIELIFDQTVGVLDFNKTSVNLPDITYAFEAFGERTPAVMVSRKNLPCEEDDLNLENHFTWHLNLYCDILTNLYMAHFNNDFGLENILNPRRLARLQTLMLKCCTIGKTVIEILKNAPQLEFLCLERCRIYHPNRGYVAPPIMPTFQHTRLRRLIISFNDSEIETRQLFENIHIYAPHLEHLHVREIDIDPNESGAVAFMITRMGELRQLKSLNLHLNTFAVQSLLADLKRKEVPLSDLSIADASFYSSFVARDLPNIEGLRRISLARITDFSREMAINIAEEVTNLECFEIPMNIGFSRNKIRQLVRVAQKLTKLLIFLDERAQCCMDDSLFLDIVSILKTQSRRMTISVIQDINLISVEQELRKMHKDTLIVVDA